MGGFFDHYEPTPPTPPAAAPSRQGDTWDVCEFCGFASDDVLLGVCVDCVDNDEEGLP
jgi:hypothetical protein